MPRDEVIAAVVGANLRAARLAVGLTQTQAEQRSGLPYRRISEWESGKYLPTIPNLLALADAYEVSPLVILGREPAPAPKAGT